MSWSAIIREVSPTVGWQMIERERERERERTITVGWIEIQRQTTVYLRERERERERERLILKHSVLNGMTSSGLMRYMWERRWNDGYSWRGGSIKACPYRGAPSFVNDFPTYPTKTTGQ